MPYLNSQDYDDDLNYARSGIRFKETAPNTVRVDLNVLPSEPDGENYDCFQNGAGKREMGGG
jgi:hypothetical protein